MKEGYIEYKGHDIPCTEESIKEHNLNLYSGPIIIPYLQYRLSDAIIINSAISTGEFNQSKNKDVLIDQYLEIIKLFIDQLEARKKIL